MALAPACRLARILTLLNFPNHQLKRFLHVLVVSCAGLGPAAVQLRLKRFALLGRDLALFRSKIRLVAYDDEWDVFGGLGKSCVSCLGPRQARSVVEDYTDESLSTASSQWM